jgi:ATP-dependent DNA helicase PIF1
MSYKENESNHGKKWSIDEINDLKNELILKIPLYKIAENHKRTINSVKLQGLNLCEKFLNENNENNKDIQEIYGFSIIEIKYFIQKKELRIKKIKEKKEELRKEKELKQREIDIIKNKINELPSDIKLSDDQKKIIECCDKGENVFMSGGGGTGKSYLIRIIKKRYPNKNIQVCALTGVAAEILDCGAKTINSWSGTKIIRGNSEKIIKIASKNKRIISRWKDVDFLIIDEISMMSKKYFDILNSIGKIIRKNNNSFGGIQLLFSGDFNQLPPVGDNDDESCKFCFESKSWKEIFHSSINLKTNYRQNDEIYTKILSQIRDKGGISEKSFNILSSRILSKENNLSYDKNNKPIIIVPRRKDAKYFNDKEMNKLNSTIKRYNYEIIKTEEFNCSSQTLINDEIRELEKNMTPDKITEIKIGASVMCTVNLDLTSGKEIVNGSRGIIKDIIDDYPLVLFNSGITKLIKPHCYMSDEILGLGIKQLPLILAYAITIHKSQGLTLDSAIIDAGDNIFEGIKGHGQIYVALSRIKSLDGLYLLNFNHKRILKNPKVKQFYDNI